MKTKGEGRFCHGVSNPLRDGEIHQQVADETQAYIKISGPSLSVEPGALFVWPGSKAQGWSGSQERRQRSS